MSTKEKYPAGAQTQYGYNHAGKLTSLTDPKSNTTNWTYDIEQRLIGKPTSGAVARSAKLGTVLTPRPANGGPKGPPIYNATPPLPGGLVGTQDQKAGPRGKGWVSGPLDPSHGGTGNAQKDFDLLTGGQSAPAPSDKGYPPGTVIGPNGISLRPGDGTGPRIDIPENGPKPQETLHY